VAADLFLQLDADSDGVIKVADVEAFCTGHAGAGEAGCNTTRLLQALRLTPDGTSQVVFVQGLADGAYSLADFPNVAGRSAPAAGSGNGAQPLSPPPLLWRQHPGRGHAHAHLVCVFAGVCDGTHLLTNAILCGALMHDMPPAFGATLDPPRPALTARLWPGRIVCSFCFPHRCCAAGEQQHHPRRRDCVRRR